nr:MetaGeneMark_Unknown Function [uncultured bacterium]
MKQNPTAKVQNLTERAIVETLRKKILEFAAKKPEKMAIVLTRWLSEPSKGKKK